MANRYWVGGSGNWSDNTNHWSATSGGSPNATLPTSSDNVFIDSSSGLSGGTITLEATRSCLDFTSTTGISYTIDMTSAELRVCGSLVLESGIIDVGGLAFNMYATTGSETITTNGCVINALYIGSNGNATWTLMDGLVLSGEFYQQNGTFDANDFNVTANDFYFYSGVELIPTVIMGSGMWEATGENACIFVTDENDGEVVTFNQETSTIKWNPAGGTLGANIDVGGKTLNNLWVSGTNSGSFTIAGGSIFNDIKIDAGKSVNFSENTITTLTTFTAVGTVDNLITINSSDAAQFTLSKSSGVVECDYLNISNSNATGGATWYAGSHSVDTTNNDGWLFTDKPVKTFYELNYLAGSNGTLVGNVSQEVEKGNDGTQVVAVPNRGYIFSKWSDDVMTAIRIDTNVQSDISVTATFVINTPDLIESPITRLTQWLAIRKIK